MGHQGSPQLFPLSSIFNDLHCKAMYIMQNNDNYVYVFMPMYFKNQKVMMVSKGLKVVRMLVSGYTVSPFLVDVNIFIVLGHKVCVRGHWTHKMLQD